MDREIKIIHSFWTRPLENDMYSVERLAHLVGDVWMFALSMAYVRREGFRIELHTDSLGAALLGHLPYDAVHLTLDHIPRNISPRFWAAGKIWALEAAGDDAIHIDGDVFIKRRDIITGMLEESPDFVCQGIEHGAFWIWRDNNPIGQPWVDFCKTYGITTDIDADVNTGVVGVFDNGLRERWLADYKRFVSEASRLFYDGLSRESHFTPDLFCEQAMLYRLAGSTGKSGAYVIADGTEPYRRDGFQHLLTAHKYKVVDKIKRTLEVFFPDIYASTYLKFGNL